MCMLPQPAVPLQGTGMRTFAADDIFAATAAAWLTQRAQGQGHPPGDIALADNVGDADLAIIQRNSVHYRSRAAAARNGSARQKTAWLQAMVASLRADARLRSKDAGASDPAGVRLL